MSCLEIEFFFLFYSLPKKPISNMTPYCLTDYTPKKKIGKKEKNPNKIVPITTTICNNKLIMAIINN